MDRIINVKVSGNHLTKDSNNAGTRGEANATILRITFGEEWAGYAKSITFIDAYGMNPTKLTLTADLLENRAESSLIYLVPIPKEPLRIAGDMTFSIEGWTNGKRQRAVSDTLEVKDAPITDDVDEPTPTQVEQMQNQYEAIMGDIQNTARYRNEAETFAENAEKAQEGALQAKASAEQTANEVSHTIKIAEGVADRLIKQSIQEAAKASVSAEDAEEHANRAENAVGKTSYIGENGNWYAWDGKKEEFYDTGIRAQAGSEVYVGDNPPASADVWLNPDGNYGDIIPHPDWSQNDPEKWDYIKNRPFYDDIIETKNESVTLNFEIKEKDEDEVFPRIEARCRTTNKLGLIVGQTYDMSLKGYKDNALVVELASIKSDPVVHSNIFNQPELEYDGEFFVRVLDCTSSDWLKVSGLDAANPVRGDMTLYGYEEAKIMECDRFELVLTGNFSYYETHDLPARYIPKYSLGAEHFATVYGILKQITDEHIPDTIARVADVDKKIADNRLAYEEKELIGSGSPMWWFDSSVTEGDRFYVELVKADGTTYSDTVVVPNSGNVLLCEGKAVLNAAIRYIAANEDETATVVVYRFSPKQIDDKFIPDTIARVADVDKKIADSRIAYEEEKTLVSSRDFSTPNGEEIGYHEYSWDDTSVKLHDGDIVKLHITTASGKDGYADLPLYKDDAGYWGDRAFNCVGEAFAYVGVYDDGYTGLRLVTPEGFSGTVEVITTELKTIEDKFIPETIARVTALNEVQETVNETQENVSLMAESVSEARQTANEALESVKSASGMGELRTKKVTQGSLHALSDSAEAPLQGMRIFGKTKQATTTGAQLLRFEDKTQTVAGLTWKSVNGVITVSGTATAQSVFENHAHLTGRVGTFYVSGSDATANVYVYAQIEKADGTKTYHQQGSFKLDGTEKQVLVYCQSVNNAAGKTFNATIYPMCNVGTTALPYEPYTGGMPSPSFSYPQVLESVGDDGSVEQFVMGKNLSPTSFIDTTQSIMGAIKYYDLSPATYTLSAMVTKFSDDKATNTRISANVCYTDGTNVLVQGEIDTSASERDGVARLKSVSFTVDSEKTLNYVSANILDYGSNGGVRNAKAENIQLEVGLKATPYEPPRPPQSLTIPTPNGLPGIPVSSGGNYTDENGQQWICDEKDYERMVYVQRVGAVEAVIKSVGNTTGENGITLKYGVVGGGLFPDKVIFADKGILCDSAIYKNSSVAKKVGFMYENANSIVFIDTADSTLETMKAKYDGALIYYQLATPIETPLSEEEIVAYKALHTNYPNTTIYNDEGAYTEVKYVADTIDEKYIPDTIARKTETIPSLPVGTQIMEFDGGFSDGFYGDKKMFALQEGDYLLGTNTLTIKEQGICWARRDVDYMFITFICEAGIKFFDYIDLNGNGEYSTDEPNRELPFANAESILTFSSVEDYSTTFSCMHLMSPSGNAYTVTVDDDGQLITTPHD